MSFRTCQGCSTVFEVAFGVGSAMPGYGRYCSRSCAFWSRVDKSVDNDGCWLWNGSLDRDGYGLFFWGGERVQAHREAFTQMHGPLPDGRWALHNCPEIDNKQCVRHVYAGTHADNTRDAVLKGQCRRGDQHGLRIHPERIARGERHGSAKLSAADVQEIRLIHAADSMNQRQIAKRFGVAFQTINRIVLGRIWQDHQKDDAPTPARVRKS